MKDRRLLIREQRRTGGGVAIPERNVSREQLIARVARPRRELREDDAGVRVRAFEPRRLPRIRVKREPRRQTSTVGITSYDDLPQAAKDYVKFIEDETETRAAIISTGPRREETILK